MHRPYNSMGGKSLKFNNSIVPNNSIGGKICQNKLWYGAKKSLVYVFFSTEAIKKKKKNNQQIARLN